MIKDFYKDKNILITGTTGFLGKVVLEKFFRSVQHFNKIYLLVRPKRGSKVMDRVKREIFQSKCFEYVRQMHSNFNEVIEQKIVPIEGDITKENLAMKQSDRQTIIDNVHVVINCAASVDFNERLCDAIQINYFGCLRMHDLMSECKHVEVFTHVSTCYVNCNKTGYIHEQVYDIDQDPEQLISNILKMTPEQQDQNLSQILGDYPNTYTFTKAMAERSLKKRRLPFQSVNILRPSIIGASYIEPIEGWTDTFSAAGGITLAGGVGIVNYVHGNGNNIADLVPVDFVSNIIIAVTALQANKSQFQVLHMGTSHKNPVRWNEYMSACLEYIRSSPFDKQAFDPHVKFVKNKLLFKTLFYLRSEVPAMIYDKASKLPLIGGAQMKKNAERLKKINIRVWELGLIFEHFTFNEWIYETNQLYNLIDKMSPQDREEFKFDPKTINWQLCIKLYVYGMQKFILGQDVVSPSQHKTSLIMKNQNPYFSDIRWAFMSGLKITKKDNKQLYNEVINSDLVQDQIQEEMKKLHDKGNPTVAAQYYNNIIAQVRRNFDQISAQIKPHVLKSVFFVLNKIWQQVYDQLVVNEKEIENLKALIQKKESNIVLIPTHKSYVDFLIISYLHYYYQIDMPFFCSPEDMIHINLVSYLLKSGGGFFMDTQQTEKPLFKAVMSAYVAGLLKQNNPLEVFLEKQRSRSGKLQKLNNPLFNLLINGHLKKDVNHYNGMKDINFIPITINYDRVHEGDSFPLELLGEAKQQESLIKVMKQFYHIHRHLGRVNVKFCQPISLKKFIKQDSIEHNRQIESYFVDDIVKNDFIMRLGEELSFVLSENLVIMSSGIVACVLLQHRKGIILDELVKEATWIYQEIKERGGELSLASSPSSTSVQATLKYLEGFVDRKRNIFEPSVSAKKTYKNILMLAYYRNSLIHMFINEAMISCSILGFGALNDLSKGISTQQVWQKCQFLIKILSEEFIVRQLMKTKQDFENTLNLMNKRGFLKMSEDMQQIYLNQKDVQVLNSQSFLCHLLLPFIESYLITLTYFACLDNKNQVMMQSNLYSKIQWLAEILYDEGNFKFYEACMLESIKNAVNKYVKIGLLQQSTLKTRQQKEICFNLAEQFQNEDKINEIYDELVFFQPYSQNLNLSKIQNEVRKVLHSDLPMAPRL